jgi:outer membrane protein assembly factor BamB
MSVFTGIALALVVLLLLVGCGSAGPAATPVPTTATRIALAATPVPTNATRIALAATDTLPPPTPTARVQPPTEIAEPSPTPVPSVSVQAEEPAPVASPAPLASPNLKIFGGPDSDIAYGILPTADGGALICGLANNTRIHGHGGIDGNARLVKTDPEGEPIWERDYGGGAATAFFAMIPAAEGGYVLVGDMRTFEGGDNTDMYLVKVDEQGNEIWSHTYGTSATELGRAVQQTADGGYILIGSTSEGDDSYHDVYLVKTDAQGNEEWSGAYRDQLLHQGWGVTEMPEGGYILTGFSAPDHDARDILAMRVDAMGDVEWSRTWDLSGRDEGFGITVTSDGNVVIAGVASLGSPTSKIVLLKVLWQHTLDAEEFVDSFVGRAVRLPEGGYLFVGGATRDGEESPDMLWLELTTND